MALMITLATKNEGKRLELEYWLQQSGLPIELALNESVGEIEETGRDFLENARIKAEATPPVSGSEWVLAEDSGMGVDALDAAYGLRPFPGLHSNRWLTRERRDELLGRSYPNRMPLEKIMTTGVTNNDLCHAILALMDGKEDRAARYYCGMVLWNPGKRLWLEALETTELTIIQGPPRGMNGFGYDPIAMPVGESRTVAELSTAEKNRISHRGKAFQNILNQLRSQQVLLV